MCVRGRQVIMIKEGGAENCNKVVSVDQNCALSNLPELAKRLLVGPNI